MRIGLAVAVCIAIAMTAGCGKREGLHEAMPLPDSAPAARPAATPAKITKRCPVLHKTSSHEPMSEAELARRILEVTGGGSITHGEHAGHAEPEPTGKERFLQAELIE